MNAVDVEPLVAEAGLEEVEPIAELARRVFGGELDIRVEERLAEDLAAFRARWNASCDFVLAARADGALAGGLLVGHQPGPAGGAALASWLVVAPEFRRHGLGRALLSRALEGCRARRVPLVRARVIVHRSAPVRLYWDLGFRVASIAGVPYDGVTRETVVLEKRLTPPPASA